MLALASPASAANDECETFRQSPSSPPTYFDPFIIFFDLDSDRITPAAAATLNNVASSYKGRTQCRLLIAAHADRSGPSGYNKMLSGRRGNAVAVYLRSRGLQMQMMIESHGETRPLVETADGVVEAQNRMATIVIAPVRPKTTNEPARIRRKS